MTKKFAAVLICIVALTALSGIAHEWVNGWRMAAHQDRIEKLEAENKELREEQVVFDEALESFWEDMNGLSNQVDRCILECGGPEE